MYNELIVEADSHAINLQTLQDASILNELSNRDCKSYLFGFLLTITRELHTIFREPLINDHVTKLHVLANGR